MGWLEIVTLLTADKEAAILKNTLFSKPSLVVYKIDVTFIYPDIGRCIVDDGVLSLKGVIRGE